MSNQAITRPEDTPFQSLFLNQMSVQPGKITRSLSLDAISLVDKDEPLDPEACEYASFWKSTPTGDISDLYDPINFDTIMDLVYSGNTEHYPIIIESIESQMLTGLESFISFLFEDTKRWVHMLFFLDEAQEEEEAIDDLFIKIINEVRARKLYADFENLFPGFYEDTAVDALNLLCQGNSDSEVLYLGLRMAPVLHKLQDFARQFNWTEFFKQADKETIETLIKGIDKPDVASLVSNKFIEASKENSSLREWVRQASINQQLFAHLYLSL